MKTYVMYRVRDEYQHPVARAMIRYPDGSERGLAHRVRHSPAGFEWGYAGSGPADLARSICWDVLNEEPSPRIYQRVKSRLVAIMPYEGGELREDAVRAVIADAELEIGRLAEHA